MNMLQVLFGTYRVSPYEESIDVLERERRAQQQQAERLDERVQVLTELVLNLAIEVEGLRGALAKVAPQQYAQAYREALVLSRNAAGIVPGTAKLLARFYSEGPKALREEEMLQRLGLSEEEIEQHRKKSDEVQYYT